ncbi:GCG_CRPN prefix-to-repeats domain-containing protein [Sphingomonas sp. M1A8_2b]
MKKLLLAALAVGTAITTAMPADARQGCGPRFHRGAYGRCIPNRVRRVVVVPAPRVGVFYPGRGYWHANRYWGHRYRRHGGWRYR